MSITSIVRVEIGISMLWPVLYQQDSARASFDLSDVMSTLAYFSIKLWLCEILMQVRGRIYAILRRGQITVSAPSSHVWGPFAQARLHFSSPDLLSFQPMRLITLNFELVLPNIFQSFTFKKRQLDMKKKMFQHTMILRIKT